MSLARSLRRRQRCPELDRLVEAGALTRAQAADVHRHVLRGCSVLAALELAARGWPRLEIGDERFEARMCALRRDDPETARRVDALAERLVPILAC